MSLESQVHIWMRNRIRVLGRIKMCHPFHDHLSVVTMIIEAQLRHGSLVEKDFGSMVKLIDHAEIHRLEVIPLVE